MRVHDQQVTFNVFKTMRFPEEVEDCAAVSILDTLVTEEFNNQSSLKWREIPSFEDLQEGVEDDEAQVTLVASRQPRVQEWRKPESLDLAERVFKPYKPSIEEPLVLELKPLPLHLRYAYLGENNTLLVIISSA